MVDVKREDLTLQDWTKGISADEFAWGSYFYSEWISSGYSTKWFELGYKYRKWLLNSRRNWRTIAITPSTNYWFLCFTKDGRIEAEDYWNDWDKGSLYSYIPFSWSDTTWYENWLLFGNYAIWIRQRRVDVIDYNNLFDENSQLLPNPDLSDSTWWTVGTWWTITDDWAVHTTWETWTLNSTPTWSYTSSDVMRCVLKIKDWTNGNITVTLWNWSQTSQDRADWLYVFSLKCDSTTELVITPSSTFNGTIESVNIYQYDNDAIKDWVTTLYNPNNTWPRPALCWEWDLYVASGNRVTVISLTDWGHRGRELVDENYTIVSITQQAWNLILWATNGYDSRQYYWNWVDAVATEVIEWKWLIIQWVTGTETVSYVLTTSWATSWSVEWYEYRLYIVSGYQRNLIASKLYMQQSQEYLNAWHYNVNKKFDFNDVTWYWAMTIFLDSLYIPWCDGVYKYWADIPWLSKSWTRPIKYDTWATNIVLGQRWHFLGIATTVDGKNYIWYVDNRGYTDNGYLISEAIYWDRLSTRKSLEKIKIWYKNVASSVGGIKVYAIVDDTYFWRFRPTSNPTLRPSVWDIYNIANNTTGKVIDVDIDNGVITLVTVNDTWSYTWVANTTLTKVSWDGDDSITVGYNYDNMCLIKTIESDNQWYGSDLIFGKDFVNSYMPYWYKIQFVVELSSNDSRLSPEIYEFSIHSDIDDIVL